MVITKKTLIFATIFVVLAVGAIITVTLILTEVNRAESYLYHLREVDSLISSGYYYKAKDHLDAAVRKAMSKESNIRILKRAHIISDQIKDYSILEEIAYKATRAIPGSQEIIFIAAFASIKNDNLQRACSILKKARQTEYLDSIRALAFIKGCKEIDISNIPKNEFPFDILLLINSDDPLLYEEKAEMLNNKEIMLDATLLYAKNGDIENAYRIVHKQKENPLFKEAGIFLTYDNGKLDEAKWMIQDYLTMHSKRKDLYHILADIMFGKQEYNGAVDNYLKTIQLDAEYCVTAYLNLSYIFHKQDRFELAIDYLKKAYRLFPYNKDLLYSVTNLLIEFKKKSEAEAELVKYLKITPDDIEANLLLLYLKQGRMGSVRYRMKLWDLFNKYSQNELLCKILVTYLLSIEDLDGAENALRIFIFNNSQSEENIAISWILNYQGIIQTLRNNNDAAYRKFSESLKLKDDLFVRYNRALSLYISGRVGEAREELYYIVTPEKSLLQKNASFYSRVSSRLGEILLSQKEYKSARRMLEYALEINPKNYKAVALLSDLEELLKNNY